MCCQFYAHTLWTPKLAIFVHSKLPLQQVSKQIRLSCQLERSVNDPFWKGDHSLFINATYTPSNSIVKIYCVRIFDDGFKCLFANCLVLIHYFDDTL